MFNSLTAGISQHPLFCFSNNKYSWLSSPVLNYFLDNVISGNITDLKCVYSLCFCFVAVNFMYTFSLSEIKHFRLFVSFWLRIAICNTYHVMCPHKNDFNVQKISFLTFWKLLKHFKSCTRKLHNNNRTTWISVMCKCGCVYLFIQHQQDYLEYLTAITLWLKKHKRTKNVRIISKANDHYACTYARANKHGNNNITHIVLPYRKIRKP